ncbi:unnamed protein product [Paramecium octaurelia]|uniref:Uncharacterized protein n=1 Tax=Paramecium octaurelia TaxID=43137 RepID=A0A8S1VHP4_PAROT|nr:unnamed protein product [Paramecium octaurelia]
MRIFIIVGLIALSNCVSFSLTQRCACSEYKQTLCEAYPYCAWSGTACVDMDCTYLKSADTCTGPKSGYQCSWNASSSKCETHTYTCSEVTEDDCSQKIFGFNCMWVNDKCQDFSCSTATSAACDPFNCAMLDSSSTCSEPKSVDCSSFSTQATCNQSDGNGNMCYMNNDSVCTQYDIYSQNCGDYSSTKEYCQQMCTFVDSSKTCQAKSCADFTNQDDCILQLDLTALKVIPCTWSGTACQESTAADVEKLDIISCMVVTMLNYKWSLDDGKCTACTSFTTNPQFQYLQDYMNGSYGIQIGAIIVGLSLIFN